MTWIAIALVVIFIVLGLAWLGRSPSAPNPIETGLPIKALKIEGVCSHLLKRGVDAGRYDEADLKSAQQGARAMVAAWELMEWASPGTIDRAPTCAIVEAIGLYNCAIAICAALIEHGIGTGPAVDQLDLGSEVCFQRFLGKRPEFASDWLMSFAHVLGEDRNEFGTVVGRAILALTLPPETEQIDAIGRLVRERLATVKIRYDAFEQKPVS